MGASFRGFGFWTGWFVVIASMVGSGIFTNSGAVLKSTQNFYAVFIVWLIGGLLALAGTLTLAELASAIPSAGGDYVYVRQAFGKATGFVYGWAMVVIGFAAPVALIASTISTFMFPVIRDLASFARWPAPITENIFSQTASCFFIIALTIGHSLGHSTSSKIQGLTTFFNFALLLLLGLGGIVFGKVSPSQWFSMTPLSQINLSQWSSGTILVLYAYTGWNAATYLSGELIAPQKNLPRSLIAGCVTVTGLYLLVNISYGSVLSDPVIRNLAEGDYNRLADIGVVNLFGPLVARIFSVLVSAGMLACLSAMILTGPRIVFAMAQDGLLPAFAGRLNEKTGVPQVAIFFQGAISLLFLWSGTFKDILDFAGYGLALVGLLTVSPIFVLRKRADFVPFFRVPLYPLTPIIFLLVSVVSLVGAFAETPVVSLLSIGCILLGYPLFWVLHSFKKMQ